jgi:hypothetical protein
MKEKGRFQPDPGIIIQVIGQPFYFFYVSTMRLALPAIMLDGQRSKKRLINAQND